MDGPSQAPVPRLVDTALLTRRRVRARLSGSAPAFLADEMNSGLTDRLAPVNRHFEQVLILGNGTALPALPDSARIVRVDPAGGEGQCGVTTVDCPLDALPFPPASFDLIVSAGVLHWVDDLPGLLIQCHRVLKPDGLFLAAFPAGGTLQELRQSLLTAEAAVRGGAARRVLPFVDVRDGGDLLQRAGFAMPVADMERLTVRYRNPATLFADLRGMGETAAFLDRAPPLTRAILTQTLGIYADRFSDAEGLALATFDILYLTGWARAPGQPQPLKRGSARNRLADALGTAETSLK